MALRYVCVCLCAVCVASGSLVAAAVASPSAEEKEDIDVTAERERIARGAPNPSGERDVIVINNLRKVYPARGMCALSFFSFFSFLLALVQ